jgi:hypothetical protein
MLDDVSGKVGNADASLIFGLFRAANVRPFSAQTIKFVLTCVSIGLISFRLTFLAAVKNEHVRITPLLYALLSYGLEYRTSLLGGGGRTHF